MSIDLYLQIFVNSIITGSLYLLAAIGLSLCYGLLRILNFAHGHMMMVGAYLYLFFLTDRGLSPPLALLCSFIFIAVISFFVLKIFIEPLLKFHSLLALLSTLALGTMLESIISIVFGVNVKSLGSSGMSWDLGGVYFTNIQIIIFITAATVSGLLAYLLHSSTFGLSIRAMVDAPESSQALGISRQTIMTLIFVVSCSTALFAGVLVGYETNLTPLMGASYTIKAFAAMILGGLGNLWGTIVGSFVLGFIENFSLGLDYGGVSLPAGYRDAIAYLVILSMLLLRPQGLLGQKLRRI